MADEERDDLIEGEEEQTASVNAESGSKSKLVKILLMVAGGILLVILIFGISYLVSKYVSEKNYEKRQDIVAAPAPPPLTTYELPVFSKMTADADPHHLKMQVSLGYDGSLELSTELTKRKDELLHVINILLQGKAYEDLNSVTGMVELGEEIKAHVNMRLTSGKVQSVLFKEFIVN